MANSPQASAATTPAPAKSGSTAGAPAAVAATAAATVTKAKENPTQTVRSPGSAKPTTPVAQPIFRINRGSKRLVEDLYLKLLVYGRPGAGKTVLAGSCVDVPQMRDVLMIDAEKGKMAIDDSERVKTAGDIDDIEVSDFKQIARIRDFLIAHCKFRDAGDSDRLADLQEKLTGDRPTKEEDIRKYKTVIIDSVSEIESFNMYSILGIGQMTPLDDDMPTPEWKEYKQNNNRLQLAIRSFRDLPIHLILTCSEQWVQDEFKRFRFAPQLSGKLVRQVQGFMDIVGYLEVDKPTEDRPSTRRLWVDPVGKFDAKNRRSTYKKPFFDNPTMTDIMRGTGLLQKQAESE